jgi:hypothetical protein
LPPSLLRCRAVGAYRELHGGKGQSRPLGLESAKCQATARRELHTLDAARGTDALKGQPESLAALGGGQAKYVAGLIGERHLSGEAQRLAIDEGRVIPVANRA